MGKRCSLEHLEALFSLLSLEGPITLPLREASLSLFFWQALAQTHRKPHHKEMPHEQEAVSQGQESLDSGNARRRAWEVLGRATGEREACGVGEAQLTAGLKAASPTHPRLPLQERRRSVRACRARRSPMKGKSCAPRTSGSISL